MRKRISHYCILILLLLTIISGTVYAKSVEKQSLSVKVPWQGRVQLEGDIEVSDSIKLYQRVYKSTDHVIRDQLIFETTAEEAKSATLDYYWYAEPLEETEIEPDFPKSERYIELKALYVVVSNAVSEIRSDLIYTYCWLETGVVNQYWCSVSPSTACGPAAGLLAMQLVYPSYADESFTRLNDMRKYSLLGEDYVCDSGWFDTAGKHITNTVNKYVAEELDGGTPMVDHRTPDKSTEETLLELLTTGRPTVIEVCYLGGGYTLDFYGYSHWITLNGFILLENGYNFYYSDPIAVSYRTIPSDQLETSNAHVKYNNPEYIDRYIGAFSEPLFSLADYELQ